MSRPFRFKRFTVTQERAAMKVGTDGVLLGAWCTAGPDIRHILDIGTGTGLIALMLAQRCEAGPAGDLYPAIHIDALELEPGAFHDACLNASASPWADSIAVHNLTVQQFAAAHTHRGESTPDHTRPDAHTGSPDPTEANPGTGTSPAPDIYIYTDTGNGTNTSPAPSSNTHTSVSSDTHADTNTGVKTDTDPITTGPGIPPLSVRTFQFSDHGSRFTAKPGLDSDPEPAVEPSSPYDLIVCNPPYFTSSLLPPDRGRVLARHDASLDREELFRCAAALSRPGTLLALIVPAEKATDYIISVDLGGFGLIRRTDVHTTPSSPPKRSLLEFRYGPRPAVAAPPAETLVIETSPLNYTDEYRTLTREFYLKF